MPSSASDLFIVDNSDNDWKVRAYLEEWCELSKAIDIATGHFEIGSLLSLKEKWQGVDKIRILMGGDTSFRSKQAFAEGLGEIKGRLDGSIEAEKTKNDFLEGVPAIVAALKSGKIECRVYRKEKFHAKAYITHGRAAVVGSFALVGSSNFTFPGLSQNIELNVQIRGPEVGILQAWYERHWEEAEEVTPEILRIIERHTRDFTPFEIWFKALDEHLRGRELTPDGWDREESRIFPILDKYQQDAYRNLVKIANDHGGAFLCDGVGLGKTFVGLMLLERMVVREGKRVVLFAPKAAREDVWQPAIERYLPKLYSRFVNFVLFNHTDLRRGGEIEKEIRQTIMEADIVLIDEAHHFRNPGIAGTGTKTESGYRKLQRYLAEGGRPTQLFMLTATPVNNSVHDFRHLIELFTQAREDHFATSLGIQNLRAYFIHFEKRVLGLLGQQKEIDFETGSEILQAEEVLRRERVFAALVVQRSRAYVKQSQLQETGGQAIFPDREPPQVEPYDLKATYGRLLKSVEKAFQKDSPLFVLSVYYPLAYQKGVTDPDAKAPEAWEAGRQKQVVTLIRTLFLKRFESSAVAFERSCWRLMLKLLAWVTVHATSAHDLRRLDRWKQTNSEKIGLAYQLQKQLWPEEGEGDTEDEVLGAEELAAVQVLDPELYDVGRMLDDTFDDLNQVIEFLDLAQEIGPKKDDKLKALTRLLKTDKILKKEKVIIFTEFAETARYVERELKEAGIEGVHRIDGNTSQQDRSATIRRFSPYYNGTTPQALLDSGQTEIRVLVSTDVLSEGLNLQDATRLINYDIHWNPVRLMQRVGRVDRRMNPEIEAQIVKDRPEQAALRGHVQYWNFLPPAELDELLRLFKRVANKTLVISRTFGVEGRKLLTPDDDFDPIQEMNEQCEGHLSQDEALRLEYNQLLKEHPEAVQLLDSLPLKAFSGKAHLSPGTKSVFFCYRIPGHDRSVESEDTARQWTEAAGETRWMLFDLGNDRPLVEPGAIASLIRSAPETPRQTATAAADLAELRKRVEKQMVNDDLKARQAPLGVAPILKCWMELN
jgi:superfamily II DNA/RNA helicase